ncbi:CPBP family intramembrane glutamic endopeptidase [Curtobacterium sp. 9128]|uniref:CPBP family intramembrane glutamic endopeptidase n=1 Tax=Curtobacterium sp. 9128 TaxID=1793722 RepID=UPI002481D5C1|nr:CPBP family intramembrane glutamic endopeptidase [Curtobacterium sp. 9128]
MSVPYQRMFRVDGRWRWWRPLLALTVFLGFYLATQVLIAVAYLVPIGVQRGPDGLRAFQDQLSSGALDPTDPVVLSMTIVSLVVLLPSIMIAVRIARLGPIGQLSSVRMRVRWGWMARCLLPLLVLALIMVGIQTAGTYTVDGSGVHWNTDAIGQSTVTLGTLTLTIVLVVLLVPFQAAAEEYVFRGFLMQTIGAWIPLRKAGAVIAVLVSTVVFAILHVPNGYNIWGILDVGSFGLIAAIIVLRTGGLEATILQHALNNVTIFVLQAPGWSKIDLDSSNGSAVGWLITLGTSLLYWGMIEFTARRSGLDRRFPGSEAPRFRGPVPAWAGGSRWVRPGGTGWSGAPARSEGVAGSTAVADPVDNALGVAGRP